MSNLPLQLFPGFTGYGLVSKDVIEIATVFNAEGVDALMAIPENSVAWADVGTRVTPGINLGQAKIPIRLTSLLGFEPFDGTRKFHPLTVAAIAVKVAAQALNLEWPLQLTQPGAPAALSEYYGISGVASDVVGHARAVKADMAASVIIAGQTNSALGMTAQAYTLAQPGLPNGLPFFSDGSTSGSTTHFANPMDGNSKQFANLYLNAGKFTDTGVLGKVMTDMTQVPHPSKANMTMGLQVTDFIGGTNMLIPFWAMAVQTLQLQTTTSPANLAAATTNIYTPEMMKQATQMIGASGLAPWRFWIAPQLDAHPYIVKNPTAQMWLAISQSRKGAAWCEFGAPTKEFTPRITLMGDGTEQAQMSRMVRMLGDLDAGAAAGLPHFAKLYYETTPA